MPIATKTDKNGILLTLEGDISDNDTPTLAHHFVGNLNKTITLDMKKMCSLDILTTHMLRAADDIVKKYGGKLIFINIPEDMADKPYMKMLSRQK